MIRYIVKAVENKVIPQITIPSICLLHQLLWGSKISIIKFNSYLKLLLNFYNSCLKSINGIKVKVNSVLKELGFKLYLNLAI